MEILLLGIYSFFVWLIFFKFRLLPWNFISQVIVITIPAVGLTVLILMLNIVAPSSHDIRVVNYVVPINPPVRGLVTEVPIEPNRPIRKGDVLFKVDPVPFEIAVRTYEAQLAQLRVQLVTATASSRNLQEQLKSAALEMALAANIVKSDLNHGTTDSLWTIGFLGAMGIVYLLWKRTMPGRTVSGA